MSRISEYTRSSLCVPGTSLDELVGRTEPSGEVEIQNPKLHALDHEINGLSDVDQQVLVILLDTLIKRSRMGHVLAS